MDRKLFREAMQNVLPYKERPVRKSGGGRSRGRPKGGKKSGTTIFAMRFSGGILLCGDRKTSGYYYDVVSLKSVKISQVGPRTALSYSGLVGSGQKLIEALKEENRYFYEASGFPLSLPGQAHVVTDFCREYFENDPHALEIDVILSGCDWDDNFFIYNISEDGSRMSFSDTYCVSGSGTYNARTILDSQWRPNLTMTKALKLAMEAQYEAGLRDSGTSHLAIARPNVAVITEKGFTFLDEVIVQKARQAVLSVKQEVV